MDATPKTETHYITRPCGHGKFLPTGEFRPAKYGEDYLLMDEGPRGKQTEYAYHHLGNMPDSCPVVILQCIEHCPSGDYCPGYGAFCPEPGALEEDEESQ